MITGKSTSYLTNEQCLYLWEKGFRAITLDEAMRYIFENMQLYIRVDVFGKNGNQRYSAEIYDVKGDVKRWDDKKRIARTAEDAYRMAINDIFGIDYENN
jgi:hypothetical protein